MTQTPRSTITLTVEGYCRSCGYDGPAITCGESLGGQGTSVVSLHVSAMCPRCQKPLGYLVPQMQISTESK